MKLRLRLVKVEPDWITEELLVDGEYCGTLRVPTGAYQLLGAALLIAQDHMRGHIEVQVDYIAHDEHGNFAMPKEVRHGS